jgi:hypothetical protein
MILRGADPRPVLREAMDSYTKAIALDHRFMSPYNNLGHSWTHFGDYERLIGIDPSHAYLKSAQAGRSAHDVNPAVSSPTYVVANAYRLLADVALERGRDPRPHGNESLAWSEKEIRIAPREHGGYFINALAHLVLAQYERIHGRPWDAHETTMLRRFEEATELSPDSLLAHMTRARIRYWQAGLTTRPEAERRALLDDVISRADHATQKHEESAELAALIAECLRARAALSAGAERQSLLRKAEKLSTAAREMNPLMAARVEKEAVRMAAAPRITGP